ncbi:MAG: YdcF family protein [Candidatus Margulisiibacteriota bacterium]
MRQKLYVLILVLAAIIGSYLAYPYVLEGAARFLIVRDKLEPAETIIVLSGDNNGERVNEAVQLYRAGYAKKLLLSGGPLAWQLTAASWMKHQARALRVPETALIIEDKSRSTIDNALFSLPLVQQLGHKSVILVTSPPHSRRSKRVFRKVFNKEGIKVISWPAQETEFKLPRWWTRHEDTQFVMWEYVTLVYYFLKGY